MRLVGWKNGSESLGMLAGERGGVTLISEEKAGCNVFDKSKASSLLKRSDHLLSSSANLLSVESEVFLALESDESEDFLTFAGSLSFFKFLFRRHRGRSRRLINCSLANNPNDGNISRVNKFRRFLRGGGSF